MAANATDLLNSMKARQKTLYVGTVVAVILAGGLGCGLGLAPAELLPQPYSWGSNCLGWLYFFTWSYSFYPQIATNFQRKSVVGLSFDFVLLNIIGFAAYSIYTLAFFAWEPARELYRLRHHGQNNGVRVNDVIFALHALAATLVVGTQVLLYDRGSQALSRTCIIATSALFLGCATVWAAAESSAIQEIDALTLVYAIGFIKIGITAVKYVPQVLLSFQRKSTNGFNIGQVVCDITGSVFSLGQQALEAFALSDPSVMTGNSIKLLIGLVSLVYDAILIVQHYVLYPEAKAQPLLPQQLPAAGSSSGQRRQHTAADKQVEGEDVQLRRDLSMGAAADA